MRKAYDFRHEADTTPTICLRFADVRHLVARATLSLPAGDRDISVDPQFANQDSLECYLAADSPCINAGEYLDWLFFDYDGDRRTGTLLDIGADEYGSDYLSFVPAALKRYAP